MNQMPAMNAIHAQPDECTGRPPGAATATAPVVPVIVPVIVEAPRFIDSPALRIVGLTRSYRGTNAGIPQQWEAFFSSSHALVGEAVPQLGSIPGQAGPVAYGVCYHGGREGFEYLSGVEVREDAAIPEGMAEVRLPAQRYAVFPHRGHVATLAQLVHTIFEQWMPTSGYQPGEHPDLFERYAEDFDAWTGLGGMEVWIPIKISGPISNQTLTMSSDEQQIRTLIDKWLEASQNKDLEGVMAHHTPDMLAFDVMPPMQFEGAEAYRKHWANCFPMFPADYTFSISDVKVVTGTDMALGTCFLKCTSPDIKADAGGCRSTFVFRKMDGQWNFIHEHHSVPMECGGENGDGAGCHSGSEKKEEAKV